MEGILSSEVNKTHQGLKKYGSDDEFASALFKELGDSFRVRVSFDLTVRRTGIKQNLTDFSAHFVQRV
jgi:hypothetical protein